MRKSFFLLSSLTIVATLSIMSCSKKSNTTNTTSTTTGGNNNQNNTPNTAITLTLAATGEPTGTTFSGALYALKTNLGVTQGNATFFSSPTTLTYDVLDGNNGTNTVTLDTISVNDTLLHSSYVSNNASTPYYDRHGINFASPANWIIKGGTSAIQSFIYTNSTALPTYSGAGLPTTINHMVTTTLTINGASTYDMAIVTINGSGGGSASTKPFKSGASVIFSATNMANVLQPGPFGSIQVVLVKYDARIINGKNFLFSTAYSYTLNNVNIL